MRSIQLFGETFAVTEDPADLEFAMLEFQEVAEGTEAESAAGGAAVMNLLKACLADAKDWPRFKQVCRSNRARVERDLMPIVVEVMTDRPTRLPSDSSAGVTTTAPNSTADSSSQAMRLVPSGRSDLAQIVQMAQQAG